MNVMNSSRLGLKELLSEYDAAWRARSQLLLNTKNCQGVSSLQYEIILAFDILCELHMPQ